MRRRLLAVTTVAMLAVVTIPGVTSAVSQAWEGKAQALLYEAGTQGCVGPLDTNTGPFGTVKINVKDGFIKIDIKIDGFIPDWPLSINVAQEYWDGSCHDVDFRHVGDITLDDFGKGGFKVVVPYVCGATLIYVEALRATPLSIPVVSLPTPVGVCI